MQKALNIQPMFTWQGNSLFCGSVLIASLRFRGRDDGDLCYEIEHAAFANAGGELWDNRKFCHLKRQSFDEIADMVKRFYIDVFDKLEFTMTIH
jgi:hypothetical protein